MEFIVDTSTHRRAYEERRLLFSWTSFYAGVGVALGMMLIAFNVVPHVDTTITLNEASAASPCAVPVVASEVVESIEATRTTGSEPSAALERLRARGDEELTPIDREYAAVALMEVAGRTRSEAERTVHAWVTCSTTRAP